MTPHNNARLILSQRDNLPPDVEGPVLSVSSIMAIVVAIVLAVTTMIALFFFVRRRRLTSSQTDEPVANQPNPPAHNTAGFEMTLTAPQIVPSSRSSTYDQGVPEYDPSYLPEYLEKPPPSPSAASSSHTC